MYFLSLVCTLHYTVETNGQRSHRADDINTHAPAVHSQPPLQHTTDPVVGGWKGKDKMYFHNVSLIDSDSFQVPCCFPNLIKTMIYHPLHNGLNLNFPAYRPLRTSLNFVSKVRSTYRSCTGDSCLDSN